MIMDNTLSCELTTNNKEDNLTTMEWEVYKLLKERTKAGLWTMQVDIHDFLLWYGKDVSLRECRKIVYNIRHCNRIQKILLSSNKGYKFMTTPEEEMCYLDSKLHSALKKLKQYHKDMTRLSKNGQMKLTFDTQERNFIESLLKDSD